MSSHSPRGRIPKRRIPNEEHTMGKIVSNFFISLDGVVESPNEWHFPYFNDEMGAAIGAGMSTASAFMMGRTLYEQWSEYWPSHGHTTAVPEGEPQDAADPFADFINNIPKYVVSNSLTEATWNNTTLISGPTSDDVAEQIRDVKARTDGDIGISGSATLVRSLIAAGLLDELQLLVHPIVVGHGQRLFEDGPPCPLELLNHTVFTTGVLHLGYAPQAAQ
jgi:dihydrofolate reductase